MYMWSFGTLYVGISKVIERLNYQGFLTLSGDLRILFWAATPIETSSIWRRSPSSNDDGAGMS